MCLNVIKFFFPKVFPRESTLVISNAADGEALSNKAKADGFLVVATKQFSLTAGQAAAFCASDDLVEPSAAKLASLSAGTPENASKWHVLPGCRTKGG